MICVCKTSEVMKDKINAYETATGHDEEHIYLSIENTDNKKTAEMFLKAPKSSGKLYTRTEIYLCK